MKLFENVEAIADGNRCNGLQRCRIVRWSFEVRYNHKRSGDVLDCWPAVCFNYRPV